MTISWLSAGERSICGQECELTGWASVLIKQRAGPSDQQAGWEWRSIDREDMAWNGVLEVATHLQAGNGNQMAKQEGRSMAEREW